MNSKNKTLGRYESYYNTAHGCSWKRWLVGDEKVVRETVIPLRHSLIKHNPRRAQYGSKNMWFRVYHVPRCSIPQLRAHHGTSVLTHHLDGLFASPVCEMITCCLVILKEKDNHGDTTHKASTYL